MSIDLPRAQEWQPEHLRRAVIAAGVALWAWNVDTDAFTMDEQGFELWGLDWAPHVTFGELSEHIHPADRDRVRAAFAATRSVVGPYETDFRILVDDEVRWVASRGQGDDAGIVGRTMFGIFLDVTGRKQAEEAHELLAGEMSHRVKNLLAIASGLTSMSARSAATKEDMASELIDRLSALGRAHDLVRPVAGDPDGGALLGDLISVLLAPYDDRGAFKGRLRVAVERTAIGHMAATALALVLHELATNSMKYGALSNPNGTLDVSSKPDGGNIVIIWTENGGPDASALRPENGFGSKLVERAVRGQLRGEIHYEWAKTGLIVSLKLSRERLAQ